MNPYEKFRERLERKATAKLYDPTVTVCSQCLRACCWQGEFMCDEARYASTVKRKISTLVKGEYGEHPDYWNIDLDMGDRRLLTTDELLAHGLTGDMTQLEEINND